VFSKLQSGLQHWLTHDSNSPVLSQVTQEIRLEEDHSLPHPST